MSVDETHTERDCVDMRVVSCMNVIVTEQSRLFVVVPPAFRRLGK